MAAELLRDVGFNVDVAANGLIALERLNNNAYALVLMDMQMPEMDGIEATIAIRQNPRYAQLPIVAMTANVMQGDRERCLQAGMNDHLGKPIEPEELWNKLLHWIPVDSPLAPETIEESAINTSDPEISIPHIPGLNSDDGLRRVLGKKSLYLKMLHKFVASQSSFLPEITQALGEKDYGFAERLAHTLKGVAGNIGAQELQQEAAELEKAIKEQWPQPEVENLLTNLGDRLDNLIAQLTSNLPPEPATVAITLDQGQLEEICDHLAQLLGEDDAEAADLLQNHGDLLRQAFPDHYSAIAAGINNFDFEAALAALTTARQFSQP